MLPNLYRIPARDGFFIRLNDCLIFWELRMIKNKFCVYTTMIGDYEKLNEQPLAVGSAIPFICLTDNINLHSDTWQIRQVSPLFPADPIRSQRNLKIRPHLCIPEFDASLYIDNSVLLSHWPKNFDEFFDNKMDFLLPEHSYRSSVLDEFLAVSEAGFDDQNRIFEQLNH